MKWLILCIKIYVNKLYLNITAPFSFRKVSIALKPVLVFFCLWIQIYLVFCTKLFENSALRIMYFLSTASNNENWIIKKIKRKRVLITRRNMSQKSTSDDILASGSLTEFYCSHLQSLHVLGFLIFHARKPAWM